MGACVCYAVVGSSKLRGDASRILCFIISRLKLITTAKQLTVNKAFIKVTKTYVFSCFCEAHLGRDSNETSYE